MSGSYRTADATVAAHSAFPVVPSDSTILPTTRALYVGAGGHVTVLMAEDETEVTFIGVPSGTILPIQVIKVLAATTATSILALN